MKAEGRGGGDSVKGWSLALVTESKLGSKALSLCAQLRNENVQNAQGQPACTRSPQEDYTMRRISDA